ncbi:hypothetical protein [Ectobacillus funiculus]|nr:hypothetical protein [Ectobacillus funiculus]
MFAFIILCFVIYLATYFCLRASGQSMEVESIQSINDYFIQSNEK